MKTLKKILIADDNEMNLKVLKASLESEGLSVIAVSNGLEALKVLEKEPIDGIISDVLMPTMDGYRFCSKAKADDKFKNIPFLLYSSTHFTADDEKVAYQYGADGFLVKPTPTLELIRALKDLLASKELRPSTFAPPLELETLKEYSEVFIQKLEKKNKDLAMEKEKFQSLSEELEHRVKERTTQLEEANQELESFSYSVSHDLRAPLRGIEGFSRILSEDHSHHLGEEEKQLLKSIVMNTQRMRTLIDDLLSFSRLSRKPMESHSIDMRDLATNVVEEQKGQEPHRSVEVILQSLPATRGDPSLIRQVLTNLVSNAWKYTRKQPHARVEIGSLREGRDLVYYIKDNGIGFDMNYSNKLFQVFQRLHSPDEFEGTGIGLALVQRILSRHGGRIWAEGRVNDGATFYFMLPEGKGTESP